MKRTEGILYTSTWLYRTVGRINKNYSDTTDGEPFRMALWADGTIPVEGFQNGSFDIDGVSLYLDVPYPESLASGNDSIFADVISSSSYDFETYSAYRKEWASSVATGASFRNPDLSWTLDQKHWSRLIFTLCVETEQFAEWVWTEPGGNERVKLVEDDTLDCWVSCPGTVVKTSKTDSVI